MALEYIVSYMVKIFNDGFRSYFFAEFLNSSCFAYFNQLFEMADEKKIILSPIKATLLKFTELGLRMIKFDIEKIPCVPKIDK